MYVRKLINPRKSRSYRPEKRGRYYPATKSAVAYPQIYFRIFQPQLPDQDFVIGDEQRDAPTLKSAAQGGAQSPVQRGQFPALTDPLSIRRVGHDQPRPRHGGLERLHVPALQRQRQ